MTQALGSFVVPEDVSITAAERLPAAVRRAAGAGPGDFTIMRPRGRARGKVVDGTMAALLEVFREAQPIADAIITFSRQRRLDPESILIAAFPLLSELARDGFLVPMNTPAAGTIVPSLLPGTRVLAFEVVSCVQVMEDTELYQVRGQGGHAGAMKIARGSDSDAAAAMVKHEAGVLARLNGTVAPRLLATGRLRGRSLLITEWCSGVSPDVVAEEFRFTRPGPDRAALLRLACAIADAYAALHACEVVHGDVHPRNALVDVTGSVTLLDFGLARLLAGPRSRSKVPRGGVGEFLEPEYVRAVRAGEPPPPATPWSDQYAVAALLFRLFAGRSYLDFSLREDEVHRQIAQDAPLPFAQCGVTPWPDVEAALTMALSKDPAERHRSMGEFSKRLARARVPPLTSRSRPSSAVIDRLQKRVRRRIGVDGPLLHDGLETPPFASVNFGAAGLAWAAYRFACIESRPEWLALAELWLQRANDLLDHPDAFHCAAAGLMPETVGQISLYHSRCGLHCVEAAVAGASGDLRRQGRAVSAFLAASATACDKVELALGTGGTLLGCALLREAVWSGDPEQITRIRSLGDRILYELIGWIQRRGPLATCSELRNLGMAHGWAGVLYAILRWCDLSGSDPPPAVSERLVQLAETAQPSGRGVCWPWLDSAAEHPAGSSMPGWCNGAAGFVHLWTAAHRLLGEERFARLAELAAWEAWEHPSRARSLCCGLAGRGYSLLTLFRYTGDPAWLDRARQLAERAARQKSMGGDAQFPDSLYKGEIGVALLASDLESPAEAFMPFFEPEGWPRGEDPS